MEVIYQVLPRLWGRGKLSEWDEAAFAYLKSLSVTAVWFTGIPRHATGRSGVKGDPGSPYAIEDYFDINPYLAENENDRLGEFKSLIKRAHAAGLKVLTDLVPNHVAPGCKDLPTHPYWDYDWSDTRKVDYGDPAALPALIGIVRFWAGLGVDGMRCDMVELVPREVLRELIAAVKREYPSFLFIAECYDTGNYGPFIRDVGFDLLYDKSGFYDIVRGIITHGSPACPLTWNWQRLGPLQPRMLNFLENHDEQRFASREYASDVRRSYAALAFGALFNGASFMLYAGGEIGEDAAEAEDGRTSIFNWVRVPGLQALNGFIHGRKTLTETQENALQRYRDILAHTRLPLVRHGACHDLCYCNAGSPGFNPDRHFAFLRYNEKEALLVFCNFSSEACSARIFIPEGLIPETKNGGQECPSAVISAHAEAWDAAIIQLRGLR